MEELREECRKTKEVRRAYRRFLLAVTSVRRCQSHACLKHSPLRTIPQLVISNSVFFPLPVPSLLLPVVFLLYVWVCRCGFVRNTILWLYIFLRFCAYIFVDLVKAVCSSLLVRCSAIEKTTIILFPFIFCLFIQPYWMRRWQNPVKQMRRRSCLSGRTERVTVLLWRSFQRLGVFNI